MINKSLWRNAAILASAAVLTSVSYAQTTSGDLVGIVKDPSGAVLPNAAVKVTNEATGIVTNVSSSASGEYRVTNLLAGQYDIEVTAQGFQRSALRGVTVTLNKTSTADIALTLTGGNTAVEVTADSGVTLDTTSVNLTTSFSNEELGNLPTASVGLGVINTSLLSPGVASTGGIGIGVGPSIGGQRPRNNNFEIEGIDNNNKSVTGPLVYVPNDAVGGFTLITNQFSPEFGHSSGGQFNTTVISGTNKLHGVLYDYFQNRNLNAASGLAGGKVPNPRYDNNRYGGEIGGPIIKDKAFFFVNYERNPIGQSGSNYLCTPTASGLSLLSANSSAYSATNLAQYLKYTPAATVTGAGGGGIDAGNDNACGNQSSGPQSLTVTNALGGNVSIPLGNYLVQAPNFSNFAALAVSGDYNISPKDSFRLRYIYNTLGAADTAASLPVFFTTQPFKYHLVALSEYHTFTPNLTNEFRLGFNRYTNVLGSGAFTFPGLDQFPNLSIGDQANLNIGPDGNAPQGTIQNLYQATDNISYLRGRHNIKIGFDGRKYISPQSFTQRFRGDYQYGNLDSYLHDLAPDVFGERSAGNHTYYGDQTALYGYGNDTFRVLPTLTLNVGLRYEFTSVPFGERSQSLNKVASIPGVIQFNTPQPTYTSFAPRFGINYAPDDKTSIRAGFGIAYDVLFDNLGTLSFPPEYSVTQDVGSAGQPAALSPNFLKNGGLPPGSGTGTVTYASTSAGVAAARAATSAYIPDQITPYAETYTLTIQRTFLSNYTAEVGYVGTRGIHLATQDQINRTPKATLANQLPTFANGNVAITSGGPQTTTLAAINALSNIAPAFLNQPDGFGGTSSFTGKITSYQPYSSSNYNAFIANLTRRFQKGLQLNLSYTYSKTMDDATAEVFATVLTPRRQQNSQNIAADYSRSALDRTNRITLEVLYDFQPYKSSNSFLLKNLVGNWQVTPIYTYESPEYATTLSGVNSNLNGDTGSAIDRPNINSAGVRGTGTGVVPIINPALAGNCTTAPVVVANGMYASCAADIVGYSAGSTASGNFVPSNAYYVQAGLGTAPTAGRNTLPIRPIDNVDLAVYKRITFRDRYSVQFGVQAFNVLNHAQYIPGTVDNVNATSYTASYNFQTVTSAFFNRPDKEFTNNARTMQLTGKISF